MRGTSQKFRALDLTGDGTLSVRADDMQMFEVYSNMKEGGVEKSKHGPGVVVDFLVPLSISYL